MSAYRWNNVFRKRYLTVRAACQRGLSNAFLRPHTNPIRPRTAHTLLKTSILEFVQGTCYGLKVHMTRMLTPDTHCEETEIAAHGLGAKTISDCKTKMMIRRAWLIPLKPRKYYCSLTPSVFSPCRECGAKRVN